jgi:hypothetical protein
VKAKRRAAGLVGSADGVPEEDVEFGLWAFWKPDVLAAEGVPLAGGHPAAAQKAGQAAAEPDWRQSSKLSDAAEHALRCGTCVTARHVCILSLPSMKVIAKKRAV